MEFQVQKGQGLIGLPDCALVGWAINGLLNDIRLNEALLPVLQLADPPLHGCGLLRCLPSQVMPDIEKGGFHQAHHARGELDPPQKLVELLLQSLARI